jgi:hypothetical protein
VGKLSGRRIEVEGWRHPFLTFDLYEEATEIRLTITAPEAAPEAVDTLFEQFVAAAPAHSACARDVRCAACAGKA